MTGMWMRPLAIIATAGFCTPLAAQTVPPSIPALMEAPLGETTEPQMALFILNVAPGVTIPTHQHSGSVFAYVLEGDIENQLGDDPPQVFHPGGLFHERPGQIHRALRNLSKTAPAKLLIFQNTGSLPASIKPLLQAPLASLKVQEVRVIKLNVGTGPGALRPHRPPGPIFAYILKGEIENQVEPDPPKAYRAGDVFFEAPLHIHRQLRNLSKTEPAEILIFQVLGKGEPGGMSAE